MKPKAILVMNDCDFNNVYGPDAVHEIESICELVAPQMNRNVLQERMELMADVEILFSGWGAPFLTADFLAKAPKLKAVFYAAGSIHEMVSDAFWNRGIVVTSSWSANAIPVSEFTLSEILFSLKQGWHLVDRFKKEHRWIRRDRNVAGLYGSTVGLLSLGMIGKRVARLLKNFELNVIAYDPFATQETASELGVTLKSLDEVFLESDVVSCHTPWLPATVNMIRGKHFRSMKENATFINTARGAVIAEEEMLDVLGERPDLTAVLDVTWPEPPKPESRLYTLPNVFITPHIAGATMNECRRMGRLAIEQCKHYLANEPMEWQISKKMAETMA